jgi:hypothetical protein
MLGFVTARLEFIALSKLSGVEEKPLVDAFVVALEKKLSMVRNISVGEAAGILEVLTTKLGEDTRAKAAIMIASHTSQDDSSVPTAKLQNHEFFEAYLTAQDWAELNPNSGKTESEQLMVLVQRCAAIGLTHPSEQTVKRIIAIKSIASRQVNAQKALQDVREFKGMLRSCTPPGMSAGPAVYQESPMVFKEMHPMLYKGSYTDDMLPVVCPHSRTDLVRALYGTPCRSSKAGCKEVPAERSQMCFSSTSVPPFMLQLMLPAPPPVQQQAEGGPATHGHTEDELP